MATRKTAAKTATAKKVVTAASKNKAAPAWSKVQLPAGFRAITTGAYGEEWEYEKNPLLQGEIASEVREVSAGKGKDKRISRVVTVKSDDDGKSYTVWESASLRAWFDNLRVGMQVAVVFKGYKDVGRPQPMKNFEGAFTDEDADAVGVEAEDEPTPRRAPAKKAAAKKTRR